MPQFRTEIRLNKVDNQIDYNSNLLLIGSCFTENIGNKLSYFKFKTTVNPFGILFHPRAIENLIDYSISDKVYTNEDLIFHNERWHSFDAHSMFSNPNKVSILLQLNLALKQTKSAIKKASHVIITLGTAWVYQFTETKQLVANCHKIPQKKFHKKLLSTDEIVTSLQNITQKIKFINPKATVIFTLSPVRHIRDGFVENMQSKAHLLSAIHKVDAHYFPAYEIMMDDLRDYRFYKKDMLHPNETSIDYIWDKFVEVWMNSSANNTMEMVAQIQRGLAHKPFNQTSEQHQCFLRDLQMKMDELDEEFGIVF